MGVRYSIALSCLLTIGGSGCRSIDPAFCGQNGVRLAQTAPAPYRVAVAPVEISENLSAVPSASDHESDLFFPLNSRETQNLLVRQLRQLRASSEVLSIAAEDPGKEFPDLVLISKLRASPFKYIGHSDRFLISGILWLTTRLGGLWVEDSTYEAKLSLECTLVNPHDRRPVAEFTASSDRVNLIFWDRNALLSMGFLQTLIIPPFWTSDEPQRTSRALSEQALRHCAARLTGYLKERFTASGNLPGELRIVEPSNDTDVGSQIVLRGTLLGADLISRVTVYLNDDIAQPVLEMGALELPAPSEQAEDGVYSVPIAQLIRLRSGRNVINIEFEVGGSLTSRTLVVYND